MGFKDKVRNNQNAEHTTIEDYHKSMQEKYLAERASRGKLVTVSEVPSSVIVEPIKQPIKAEQFEEVPAVIKSRIFESVEPAISDTEEEYAKELEEKKESELKVEAVKEKSVSVKLTKKKIKSKKKDTPNP